MIPVINIHMNRSKLPGDVYIGRPGPFGNPYKIGKDGDRDEVVAKFRLYLGQHPELVDLLISKNPTRLTCFCKPRACHGDVYAEAIEARRLSA